MSYEVLARKWRPRRFDDVVGQEHVTRTLCNAILAGRLAHAYLFVGPRGIGKTSLARIFAQALNCEHGPTETPCGECGSCREIATGNNLDVLEIDGASNNRVEEVRDLRDKVKFLPAHGRFKIYIIDEVHMLSSAAFNALLKTLEEPPPHVKFIFATTEPQKILATILSRCQRFDLRRITVADIVERLRTIAAAEGIAAGNDALAALARAAEGSLRDAVSSLDQLRAFKGDKIEEEDVLAVFGLVSHRTLQDLAAAVLQGDVRRIIAVIQQLESGGKDMQRLLIELLDLFRNVLVVSYAPDGMNEGDMIEDQLEAVRALAGRSDSERLLRITDLLVEAEPRLRYALSRRTLLETTLIRCARAAVTVSIDQIIARLDAMGVEPSAVDPVPAPRLEAALPLVTEDVNVKKKPVLSGTKAVDVRQSMEAAWHEIVEAVGHLAPMSRTALVDARPVEVGQGIVVIGLDPEFADDMQRLQHPRTKRALQRVLAQYSDGLPEVKFRLMTERERSAMTPRLAEAPDVARSASPPVEAASDEPAPASEKTLTVADWRKDPLVSEALDVFGGTIIEVRD